MSEPCRLRQDEGYGACDDEGKVLGVSPSSGYELMSSLQSSLHSTRQICQVSIPLPCSSSNGKTPSIRPPSCWRPPACSTTRAGSLRTTPCPTPAPAFMSTENSEEKSRRRRSPWVISRTTTRRSRPRAEWSWVGCTPFKNCGAAINSKKASK